MKQNLSQYDIIYDKPPSCWQDGFVMGNGNLGAVYHGPETLNFLINKTDVIDSRTKSVKRIIHPAEAEQMVSNGATAHDFKAAEIEDAPEGIGPKTCCILQMDIGMTSGSGTRSALPKINSKLSIKDATTKIALDKHLCHPKIKSFIDANSNTFILKATDISTMVSFNNRIFFSRPEDIAIGDPELWIDGERIFMKMNIPESGYYIVGMQIVPRETNSYKELINKHIRSKCWKPTLGNVTLKTFGRHGIIDIQGNFDLFLTVVTDRDTDNPLAKVNDNLNVAIDSGIEHIYSKHCQWWNKFWSKSSVELGEKTLNELFYRSLYALGSAYRNAPTSGLLGLAYGPSPGPIQYTPWTGDLHHDLNIQCPLFPVFALNHSELFDAYRETYHSFLPAAKKLAKDVFNADGAHFNMNFNAHGKPVDHGLGTYRYAYMGSYVAMIHNIAWKYKQDIDELRDRIYPFLKAVIKFYQSIIKRDIDGKYRLWPAHAVELDVMDCANPVQVISMLKISLKTAIEAIDILAIDQELKPAWLELLTNLPQYPIGIDQKARKVVLGGKGIHPDHHTGQAGNLYPVYPCGEIDEFSDKKTLELYQQTLDSVLDKTAQISYADDKTFYFRCVWQCFFRGMTALRLGKNSDFWNFYLPMFMKAYVKPNGLCSHDACVIVDSEISEKNLDNIPDEMLVDVNDLMPKFEAWCGHDGGSTSNNDAKKYAVPLIEASADYLTMITETLIQSHNGIIRLFPAWMKDKDAKFENLVAEGDIKVSSEIKKGEVCFVNLTKGKNCRSNSVKLKSPWTGKLEEYEFPKNGIIKLEN
jgi:glycosyl hydrolase family 95